jgi:NosR/NirI family nitrous oxide reductase transcriptional regulator
MIDRGCQITGRVRVFLACVSFFILNGLHAEGRYPKPDFSKTNHQVPHVEYELAAGNLMQFLDLGLLLLAMALTVWAVHRKRSRGWTFAIMIVCLVYFGFVKKGCICSVGAIQNVSHALLGNGYAVPLTVVLTFMAPLVVALFFGRVFCAAVCPLGGIQDCVVLKRPIKLPRWLVEALSLFPYVYLAAAVLFAATGTSYLICRFDPFVAFFRLSGSSSMLFFGALMISLGVFVARPYCRFLCPYGVLLGWLSRFTWKRVRITPSQCISCKLCEETCPFDLIDLPREPEARPAAAKYLKAW